MNLKNKLRKELFQLAEISRKKKEAQDSLGLMIKIALVLKEKFLRNLKESRKFSKIKKIVNYVGKELKEKYAFDLKCEKKEFVLPKGKTREDNIKPKSVKDSEISAGLIEYPVQKLSKKLLKIKQKFLVTNPSQMLLSQLNCEVKVQCYRFMMFEKEYYKKIMYCLYIENLIKSIQLQKSLKIQKKIGKLNVDEELKKETAHPSVDSKFFKSLNQNQQTYCQMP